MAFRSLSGVKRLRQNLAENRSISRRFFEIVGNPSADDRGDDELKVARMVVRAGNKPCGAKADGCSDCHVFELPVHHNNVADRARKIKNTSDTSCLGAYLLRLCPGNWLALTSLGAGLFCFRPGWKRVRLSP